MLSFMVMVEFKVKASLAYSMVMLENTLLNGVARTFIRSVVMLVTSRVE